MVRITDVAKAAGVSPSTVSHVLNGKRPISEKTKAKVFRAIDTLGYTPNPNAQALKSTHTGIIGFFASDITELFVTQIIRGVEKITRERNTFLLFASGVEFNYDVREAVKFLRKRRIDGLIISYGISQRFSLDSLRNLDIPLVTINTRLTKHFPAVLPDNFDGGYQAAQHLFRQGARIPAIIAGPEDRIASTERIEGFLAAVKELDIDFKEPQQIYYGDFSAYSGEQGFQELLQCVPAIDGIFCANDYMAAGALNAALKNGIPVPEKMKILGFDNREFASFWSIPITTFAQPLTDMGRTSAQILFDLIEGKEPQYYETKLKSTLIKRNST
ncbi:LacI family DNA-binding transcriptional regulator [Marispirochaeta sp.]|jgi:DNA-binding LacI/PurR family transcriptional regulator|uniref:LacI family DNA-binding transcriptional regulator n=1 Tax=Marispirochaeta sp. TaxID=2038653 RepID=UPI0029C61105|nr:LacI family DNA-binding transcriptional regulator [Marispirochaeta sp.]